MVATADADPTEIEHGGDVVGMKAIDKEGGQSTTLRLLLRRGPQNAQPINGLQP